jgi:hypothetical protein
MNVDKLFNLNLINKQVKILILKEIKFNLFYLFEILKKGVPNIKAETSAGSFHATN